MDKKRKSCPSVFCKDTVNGEWDAFVWMLRSRGLPDQSLTKRKYPWVLRTVKKSPDPQAQPHALRRLRPREAFPSTGSRASFQRKIPSLLTCSRILKNSATPSPPLELQSQRVQAMCRESWARKEKPRDSSLTHRSQTPWSWIPETPHATRLPLQEHAMGPRSSGGLSYLPGASVRRLWLPPLGSKIWIFFAIFRQGMKITQFIS